MIKTYTTQINTAMKISTKKLLLVIISLQLLCCIQLLKAQCISSIAAFPYQENFEATTGNWFVYGASSNPDWAWGKPLKSVINKAASGNNCWIVGGLTTTHYNNGEKSFLLSPCFDFSSLQHPYISFKVFWETEKKYDGANFQFSTDGGSTWNLVGDYADYVACPSSNWFNTQNINTLGGGGWSGNVQTASPCAGGSGNGSGDWVIAKAGMDYLAGYNNVQFRFAFAAGTQCNDYDGFAIDDIIIDNAPINSSDFTYSCGANNSVSFNLLTRLCPSGIVWDFGDIASQNNSSTQINPTHIFSNGGKYLVTVIVTYAGRPLITIAKQITILQVNTLITNIIKCNGDTTGNITATASGGTGTYHYSWNTNPVQTTNSISNLGANTYTVTASSAGACDGITSVILNEPSDISSSFQITKSKCGNNNGAINTLINGGIKPYKTTWSNGQTTAHIKSLSAATYNLQVTDSNNCVHQFNNIVIADTTIKINIFLGNDTVFCPGNKLDLNPGNFSFYKWQNLSTTPLFTVKKTGAYWVNVSDSNGCKASDTINVIVDCSDVFFPTAFSPNGDIHNPTFGVLGNISALKKYSLIVYDRWGSTIFKTTNPLEKWNGNLNGNLCDMGTYVWFATYFLNNKMQTQKGTITLMR
jgi:gliding motility-associated-like protein